MKKRFKDWNALLLFLAMSISGVAQELPGMEVSGFRVPEYDKQGTMTSQFFGDRAEVLGNGEVKISGLRVEFYKEDKTFLEITSPLCYYNQKKREAVSEAPVNAKMERVQLRGRGFFLNSDEETVCVSEESCVTIYDIMQQTGNSESNAVTVITSKELFFDYKAKTVHFEQNVHVQDSKLQMDCETLEVRFSEKNEINWIEALGNVKLFHEKREAYAGRVVYDIKTDEFLLEKNPKLVDGRNWLMGEQIRFGRASKQMVCEPSARLVIYPKAKMTRRFFEN